MTEKKNITVIDQNNFKNPFRKAYELRSAAVYGTASAGALGYGMYIDLIMPYTTSISAGLAVMSIMRGLQAKGHLEFQLGLIGKTVSTTTFNELEYRTAQFKAQNRIGLGVGFDWDEGHRQMLYDILKLGPDKAIPSFKRYMQYYRAIEAEEERLVSKGLSSKDRAAMSEEDVGEAKKLVSSKKLTYLKKKMDVYKRFMEMVGYPFPDYNFPGNYWIHGLNGGDEAPLSVTQDQWTGNSIFFGTTRAGKSVTLRYLVAQAIFRGEVVVIIDPKGDKSIEGTCRTLAQKMDKPFYLFHAARPSESARIDPMKNWGKPTDLASRVSELIPSTDANDPFTAFSWRYMNAIMSAMIYQNVQPSIKTVKSYIEMGVESLVEGVMKYHFDVKELPYRTRPEYTAAQTPEEKLSALLNIYSSLGPKDRSEEVDGIVNIYEHPKEHAEKMIGSLKPVLSMLTSGELGDLLSPDPEADDSRPILNLKNVISSRGILYIGLDGLSDAFVAGALGSMILADVTAVAGDIYNNSAFMTSSERQSINLFVDECSMVMNNSMLSLLNQGAGAGFKNTLFTQTFADLVMRLGSRDAALKAFGNINNKFAMRSKDKDTLDFIANELAKVSINKAQTGTNTGSAGNDGDISDYTSGFREGIAEEEVELFPPNMLPNLPNMEFIGIVAGGRVIKGRMPLLLD